MSNTIQIIMVTTACKPIVDEVNGQMAQKSLTFRAGQKYTVEKTKEVEAWLERGYCYLASQPAPKTPPQYDPPIPSARSKEDESLLDRFVETLVEKFGARQGKGRAATA